MIDMERDAKPPQVARVKPSQTTLARRDPGAMRDEIEMDDDFDTLPPDVLASMEG